MTTWEIVLSILVALGGLSGIGGILTAVSARRQVRAAATKAEIEAISLVIDKLREDYKRLVAENAQLRKKIAELERHVRQWRARYEQLYRWAIQRGLDPEAIRQAESGPVGREA